MKLKYQSICLTLCLVSLVACKNSSEIQDKIENGEQVYSKDIGYFNPSGEGSGTNVFQTQLTRGEGSCSIVDNGGTDVTLYYTKTNPNFAGEAECGVQINDGVNEPWARYFIINFGDETPSLEPEAT